MQMPMVPMQMPMYNPVAMYQQQNFNGYGQQHNGNWTNSHSPQQQQQQQLTQNIYAPQVSEQDSAYQRLPVNNRRRPVKRERPSDFVEVSGQAYQ